MIMAYTSKDGLYCLMTIVVEAVAASYCAIHITLGNNEKEHDKRIQAPWFFGTAVQVLAEEKERCNGVS